MWAGEFAYDPQLGLMQETYSTLKSKGLQFEYVDETPAPTYDDEARRREEEELQRVLEMSLHDKGGRDRWAEYTSFGSGGASGSGSRPGGSSAAPGGSGGAAASSGPAYTPAARPAVASTSRQDSLPPAVTAPAPAPVAAVAPAPAPAPVPVAEPAPAAPAYSAPPPTTQSPTNGSAPLDPSTLQIVKRVKALHDFAATEQGELSFKKGDIIKVVDRCYKDWWRGQLKGKVGLLPVNYVVSRLPLDSDIPLILYYRKPFPNPLQPNSPKRQKTKHWCGPKEARSIRYCKSCASLILRPKT